MGDARDGSWLEKTSAAAGRLAWRTLSRFRVSKRRRTSSPRSGSRSLGGTDCLRAANASSLREGGRSRQGRLTSINFGRIFIQDYQSETANEGRSGNDCHDIIKNHSNERNQTRHDKDEDVEHPSSIGRGFCLSHWNLPDCTNRKSQSISGVDGRKISFILAQWPAQHKPAQAAVRLTAVLKL